MTTDNHKEDEFRFAEGSDCCVLQKRELISNYRVRGVDHEGNPFATSIGLWRRLRPATEDDFRFFAQQTEQKLLGSATPSQEHLEIGE